MNQPQEQNKNIYTNSPREGQTNSRENLKPTFIEVFLRKLLGILLILSAVPLIMNPITIPLIILCVVFGVYMLSGKKYRLGLNLLGLIVGCILYFMVIFNSLKVTLFYIVPGNNDFVGFLLFGPSIILLSISALFMFIQGILYKNTLYRESRNRGWISFGIVFVSILLVLGLPMAKQLEIKTGAYEGLNPNGSKQNVVISFNAETKEWIYVIKRKNETDRPLILSALFVNKKQLMETDKNLTIENGTMTDGKLTIEPFKEATITIHSNEPFYTATFKIDNSLADSYKFLR